MWQHNLTHKWRNKTHQNNQMFLIYRHFNNVSFSCVYVRIFAFMLVFLRLFCLFAFLRLLVCLRLLVFLRLCLFTFMFVFFTFVGGVLLPSAPCPS